MAITSILVHVGSDDRSAKRIETAIGLAHDHEAGLTGLYVIPRIDIPGAARAYVGADIVAEQERIAKDAADRAGAAFQDLVKREGLAYEWRCEKGDIYQIAALHARYADITVIGQTPPEAPEQWLFLQLPEQLVLSSGRPAIIVPYAGSYPVVGKRVLVAWNGSREATRAVHDALPILEKAETVRVLSINPGEQRHIPGADMTAHLARHGVRAEATETNSDDIEVGDALLSRAADLGADLIVMGTYGHSRAREWVLGGVTRDLLKHMTVPVLMSH